MIGALPTTKPLELKCRGCLVSGLMYHCWSCGGRDELAKGGYDCLNGWHYSETNREHLGPPPVTLLNRDLLP